MQINPYLNFAGNAEKAFRFYQSVFGGELFIQRMSDLPEHEKLPKNEQDMLMHVALPLSNGQILMASDCLTSQGQILNVGNNNYISIAPDSREEAERLFNGLSQGGTIEMPLEDMFWGDYFGSFKDQFEVCWMINYNDK